MSMIKRGTVKAGGKGIKLAKSLYVCPSCGRQDVADGVKSSMKCQKCGTSMELASYSS
jgi:ribosomal protein L37AE/L43A